MEIQIWRRFNTRLYIMSRSDYGCCLMCTTQICDSRARFLVVEGSGAALSHVSVHDSTSDALYFEVMRCASVVALRTIECVFFYLQFWPT